MYVGNVGDFTGHINIFRKNKTTYTISYISYKNHITVDDFSS